MTDPATREPDRAFAECFHPADAETEAAAARLAAEMPANGLVARAAGAAPAGGAQGAVAASGDPRMRGV